ncbi:MAG: hypothetical protein JST30_00495 [Armatimonadetes bacterium]|nr:hypothetical protein [Armatimonadota bacterium]
MLRAYGSEGGWDIAFHEDAQATSRERARRKVLFVDSLHELAALAALGVSYRRTYLIGRDDDGLADQAEDYGVTALLTCPDHWFGPSCP